MMFLVVLWRRRVEGDEAVAMCKYRDRHEEGDMDEGEGEVERMDNLRAVCLVRAIVDGLLLVMDVGGGG